MFDSKAGDKSDATKSQAQCEAASPSCNWAEIEKKAVKASDADVNQLAKTISSSWPDMATVSRFATAAVVAAPSALLTAAAVGAATARVAAALVEPTSLAKKVSEAGTSFWNWATGNNKKEEAGSPAEKPAGTNATNASKEIKTATAAKSTSENAQAAAEKHAPEEATATETFSNAANNDSSESAGLASSLLIASTPEDLKKLWDSLSSTDGFAAIIPNAIFNPEEIIFGFGKTPERSEAAPPAPPAEQPAPATTSDIRDERKEEKKRTSDVSENKQPGSDEAPAPRQEGDRVTYIDPVKAIKLEVENGNIRTLLGNPDKGNVAEIFAGADGSRVVTKGGRQIFRFVNLKEFETGDIKVSGDTVTQKRDGQTLMIAGKHHGAHFIETYAVLHETSSETAQEAIAKLKERGLLAADRSSVIYYKNGSALIHPSLSNILEFRRTNEGIEVHYQLEDGTEVLRSPKGKVYLVDKDGQYKELSDDQKENLMRGLGTKAAVVRHLLQSMENGSPILLPDGQQVEFEDERKTVTHTAPSQTDGSGAPAAPTVTVMSQDGYTVSGPKHSLSFDQETGRLETQDERGKKIEIDLDSENFDMRTEDFVRKDGVVTFTESGTRLAKDGTVTFADGTVIGARNDVYFADGSVLYRDGTFINKDGVVVATSMNAPNKVNLDGFVSQAISMASSIAGRVQSGSFSPADIALIEANMSVVQNFINLFSLMGNLPMANSLYRSWSILKESHGKAQHESQEQAQESERQQEQVRRFLKNLEIMSAPPPAAKQAASALLGQPLQLATANAQPAGQFQQLIR